ncbi:cytochrome P450 2C31-like isoform X2 [Hyla sarda]|uniref:cytochrome P450 2C31-like isoform X2 n=1 Tax=Hyla sarda TaxID=327740 RepID=UPI0024C37D19|nr:cytochrome P450 2C31-like isoform X2 [Hyla sarda]
MLALDPVTVLLYILTCVVIAAIFYKDKEHVPKNYPPGPKPLPIIGNIFNLNMKKPYLSFQELYNAFPSLMHWIPGSHKTILPNADELHSFIREVFIKRRDELDVNDQRNLIDFFLVKQKKEKPNPDVYFHDGNLTSLVADLFAAGMDTTSATLRWGLLLMIKYPEVQKKVKKEIGMVIGSAEPQMVHRQQMPYMEAVIQEIQRFANIVPNNVPHQTKQDVILKGFFIPKGTQIIPSLTSVLRDNKYFKKPDEFYPQHFLDSDGNFVKNEAFIPFSAAATELYIRGSSWGQAGSHRYSWLYLTPTGA